MYVINHEQAETLSLINKYAVADSKDKSGSQLE
jgi:hypothetical protein